MRRDRRNATLPAKWTPAFVERLDLRRTEHRELMRQYTQLLTDATGGEPSEAQDMLARRAVWLSWRISRIEHGEDTASTREYTALLQQLVTYLKALGIERQSRPVFDIDDYSAIVNGGQP
ncbi:MAG TPA: hypothetical protein VF329_04265 [Gammaproteobacteria bacterium]